MRPRHIFFNLIFLFISYSFISAQNYNQAAEKFSRTSLTENVGYKWLKEFCSIGHRLSGSENSIKAIHWAENKMKECKFDSVWLQPVMVPHWERGKVEQAFVSKSKRYRNEKLTIVALGGSIATPSNGIAGEVLEVKNFEELEKLGDKAKGKIIFYNRPFDVGLVSTFEGYSKGVDQRSDGAVRASKIGALGVLVRSVQSSYDDVPHTGAMRSESGVTKIPAAAISVIDADFLSKAIKDEPNLKVTIKLNCKTFPDAQSYNVIGELRGAKYPNEVIVVGGHIDSWDKSTGAQDDGAPALQTMEVLDLLRRTGIKPKRTIRCVLFINEENGLRGGLEYGKYASTAKEKHLAVIESDRGAFSPRGFNVSTDSVTFKKLQTWLPVLNKVNIDWIRNGGSGADVGQVKNCKAQFGYVPDEQRYMDLHHSANDVFANVHPREMELGTAAITTLVYLISEEGL